MNDSTLVFTARRDRRRGLAAVELALTIVPLLLVAFGVAEYGRMMFTFNAMDKSVRDAARFMTAPPPTIGDATAVIIAARNIAVYGSVVNTGVPLAPDLSTTMVTVCTPATCADHANVEGAGGPINLVSVTIAGYVYNSIVTYVAPPTMDFNTIRVTMRTNL